MFTDSLVSRQDLTPERVHMIYFGDAKSRGYSVQLSCEDISFGDSDETFKATHVWEKLSDTEGG